ncbi:MAG: putative toxin-antitoxin system toxin component, PIN family [Limnochordia bacterium]|jgi:putative PIN family toxin of toxin-antitoxin system
MRIMLDTNVLISIIIFRSQILTDMMALVLTEHRLVLSSYVIEELKQVVARKFEEKSVVLEVFLQALPYEFVYTPELMDQTLFSIRDPADYPVLYSAIVEDVDILITGDKDFAAVEVEKPEIVTPSEFVEKYGK